jgi:hypothetical protein
MAATLLGKCPGCKRVVRLPEDWATRTVKCKSCGMVCQSQPTATLLARRAAAKAPPVVKPAQPVPSIPIAIQTCSANGHANGEMAVTAPQDAGAWSALADQAFADPMSISTTPRYRQKKRGWGTVIVALIFLAVCFAGSTLAIVIWGPKIKERMNAQAQATSQKEKVVTPGTGTEPTRSIPPDVPATGNEFPRRLLGISINNYVYANPTSYGTDSRGTIKRDFGQTLTKIADKFRIPQKQVYELSDSSRGAKQIPPLKPILEKTIRLFLSSSRSQDRVVLILCAHSIDVEGKPYIVPLEGDLDDVKTLLPLSWLMQQLDECPAQQKLLIADFNRFDRARGKERPNGGKLAAGTEAMLKNPPKGVQVWSACSAGQYSYEFDEVAEYKGQAIKGGAFLSMFSVAFLEGSGGIQKAEDPLPLDKLSKRVNADTSEFSVGLDAGDEEEATPEKKDDTKPEDRKDDKKPAMKTNRPAQMPFLVGEMKAEQLAYDASEPAPKPFSIPLPADVFAAGIERPEQIESLLDQILLPSLKPGKASDAQVRFDKVFPFMTETMKEYNDNVTNEEIKKNKEKYPLRFAVVDAVERLRAMNRGGTEIALPTTITETDRSDANKTILARLQRGPARVLKDLDTIMEMLAKAADQRKDEKSKRWQAHFDYINAQVKSRYVYIHEYNSAVGLIRKDILPELDKSKGLDKGWKLASTERLLSGAEVKDMKNDAKKLYVKLIKEHPKTPWEILAKREKVMALGLQWEPYGDANKPKTDPAPGP